MSPWFLLVTAAVGVSQWAYVLAGRLPGLAAAAPVHRPARVRPMSALGPIGRLGRWSATHVRIVVHRLGRRRRSASACWRRGSRPPSRGPAGRTRARSRLQARDLIQRNFAGNALVRADGRRPFADPHDRRPRLRRRRSRAPSRSCAPTPRVASVTPPQQGRDDLRRRAHRDRHGRLGGGPDAAWSGPPTT